MNVIKKFLIGLCSWFLMLPIVAQDIRLSGIFEPKDKSAASIAVLGNVGQNAILAEAKVVDGVYSITLPGNTAEGVYKLAFGMQEQPSFYFIHEGKKDYVLNFKNTNNAWRFNSNTGVNHTYLSNYLQQKDSLIGPISTLYTFVQNYPHTKEQLHLNAIKTLNEKIKNFQTFENLAIAKAPLWSKEILQHNKMFFHNPMWDNETIENSFLEVLWCNIPVTDSFYYKKPYINEKLKVTFEGLLDDKLKTEAEKFTSISTRLDWLFLKLKAYPNHQGCYNRVLFYFASSNYPYIAGQIDNYLDVKQLINSQEVENFNYRKSQQDLIGKTAPPITTQNNVNALDNLEANPIVLVFVGGNSPFSFELLNQLKEDAAHSNTYKKVIAVLLTDDNESIANFKNRFNTWEVFNVANENINELVKSYKLIYVPTIFTLNKNKKIEKILAPFEQCH